MRRGMAVNIVVETFHEGDPPNMVELQDAIMKAVQDAGYEVTASEVTLNRPRTVPDKVINSGESDVR